MAETHLIRRQDVVPLWQQIEGQLIALADRQGPGARVPSERELSEQFAVQRGTVRVAVDNLVRKGVLERRPPRGTFVAEVKATAPIALLQFHIPSATDAAFLTHIKGIEEGLAGTGRSLMPLLVLPHGLPERAVSGSLRAAGVAGVIFDRFSEPGDLPLILRVCEELPAVAMNKELRAIRIPCARPEIVQSASHLAQYLAARKCRTVCVLGGDSEHIGLRSRAESFASAAAALGLTDVRIAWGRDGEDSLLDGLPEMQRPIGIFTNIIQAAMRAKNRSVQAGLTMGADVFLATVPPDTHMAECEGMAMALRDEVGIGRAAAELLLAWIGGRVSANTVVDVPCRIVLPPH